MNNFEKAFQLVLGHEGGYVNDPLDRGGETYKGIARKANPNWDGWKLVDLLKEGLYKDSDINKALNADNDLQRRVKLFYKSKYWDVNSLDDVNDEAICIELFDTGVNMGVGTAAKFFQEALNLCNRHGKDYPNISIDGQIGPGTLKAFSLNKRRENLYKVLNCLQAERYINIARNDESQERFMHGWFNRVDFKRI